MERIRETLRTGLIRREQKETLIPPPINPEILEEVSNQLGGYFDQILLKAIGETSEFIQRAREAELTAGSQVPSQLTTPLKVIGKKEGSVQPSLFAGLAISNIENLDILDRLLQGAANVVQDHNAKRVRKFLGEIEILFGLRQEKPSFIFKLLQKMGLKEKDIEVLFSKVTGNKDVRAEDLEIIKSFQEPGSSIPRLMIAALGALLDTSIGCQEAITRYDKAILKGIINLNKIQKKAERSIDEKGKVLREYQETENKVNQSLMTNPARVLDATPILSNTNLSNEIKRQIGEIGRKDIEEYVSEITKLYNLSEESRKKITEALKDILQVSLEGSRVRNLISGRNRITDFHNEALKHFGFIIILYSKLKNLMLQTTYDIAQTQNTVARSQIVELVRNKANEIYIKQIEQVRADLISKNV